MVLKASAQFARLHEEILVRLGIDFRHISLKKGFFAGGEDGFDDPSGRPYFIDEWGIKWGKNPYYYDMMHHPLENLTMDDLDDYPWPDPRDPARYTCRKHRGDVRSSEKVRSLPDKVIATLGRGG